MNIKVTQHYSNHWTAIDVERYDGPGSTFGHGATRGEAINNLLEKLEAECMLFLRYGTVDRLRSAKS